MSGIVLATSINFNIPSSNSIQSIIMSKHLKLIKLSNVMPSIQICRSKNDSETPIPAIHRFNRKAFDTNYPKHPDPPPTTPIKRHVSRKKASNRRQSRSLAQYLADCSIESSCKNNNDKFPARPHCLSRCSLSFSDDSFESFSPSANKNQENNNKDGCCFSSESNEIEIEIETETETETLLYSSRSFSYDSSYDFCYPVLEEEPKIKKSSDNGKTRIRNLRRQLSISNSPIMRRSVLSRMISRKAEGKVKESVAVVKKSEDPYEDFKRSMLEMVLEKQMFEEKDLQQLLQCFLTLNSRQFHGVIVEAFSDIWEILFCVSPVNKTNSVKL